MRLPLIGLYLCTMMAVPLPADDGGGTGSRFVRADSPEIVYEGRTATGPSGEVRMGFPGIVIHLRFRGDSLALRLDAAKDQEYIDIAVDGAAPTRVELSKGEGLYPLIARGGGEHKAEVVRRTESWQGDLTVLGCVLGAGGVLLQPEPLPARKVMFIGDSITCGEMTDVRPGDPAKDNRMSNASFSYGKLLAQRFNAQCHLVSCGGRGMTRDWQGIGTGENAPQFYGLALPDNPQLPWDPRKYVPDAIGICLGQNDFNSGIPDQAHFVDTYVRFVEGICRDAPKAHIVLLTSPMMKDWPDQIPAKAVLYGYLQQVVAKVGSSLVTAHDLGYQPGRPGNGHPTGPQHIAMADELEPVFRQALGW